MIDKGDITQKGIFTTGIDPRRLSIDTQMRLKEESLKRMVLDIVFWDVEHGSSTYINTPNGMHIVQDLGTGSYGTNTKEDKEFSPLLHLKKQWGVNQLDGVIITHPHKDHIDDIMNFDELSPRFLYCPKNIQKDILDGVEDDVKYLYEKYFDINKKYPLKDSQKDPLLSKNNGYLDIKIFSPSSLDVTDINDLNDNSIVTVLSYANRKIMLTGDNGPKSWKELLERNDFIEAIKDIDILLAPHHGRESGYYSEIFDYFKPKLTIISDGPSTETNAVDKYNKMSTGLKINHRSGNKEDRFCVTTRKDGVIVIKIGYRLGKNIDELISFINVTID